MKETPKNYDGFELLHKIEKTGKNRCEKFLYVFMQMKTRPCKLYVLLMIIREIIYVKFSLGFSHFCFSRCSCGLLESFD